MEFGLTGRAKPTVKGLLPAGLARVDDGLAHRLDRLKAIGNGQVAPVVRFIWETFTVGEDEIEG